MLLSFCLFQLNESPEFVAAWLHWNLLPIAPNLNNHTLRWVLKTLLLETIWIKHMMRWLTPVWYVSYLFYMKWTISYLTHGQAFRPDCQSLRFWEGTLESRWRGLLFHLPSLVQSVFIYIFRSEILLKGTVLQPIKFRLYAQFCHKKWPGNFCYVQKRLETLVNF